MILDAEQRARCEQLAARLGLPLEASAESANSQFTLGFDDSGRLVLNDRLQPQMTALWVDLAARPRGKGPDPLLRAIGGTARSVIDCTAGLGTDAAHIAAHIAPVVAVEQNALVHSLLEDALLRCQSARIRQHLSLIHGDSVHWLRQLTAPVDVIYMDPMYPPRPGSAAVKKSLQLLQQLVSPNPERDQQLLQQARCHARRRVVVKRPHYAPPLLPGCSGETRGKLVRFDIYPPTR